MKQKSSGARLREAGLKPVQLWLTEEQHAKLFQAAKIENRKGTQVLIHYGFQAIEKILRKSSRKAEKDIDSL